MRWHTCLSGGDTVWNSCGLWWHSRNLSLHFCPRRRFLQLGHSERRRPGGGRVSGSRPWLRDPEHRSHSVSPGQRVCVRWHTGVVFVCIRDAMPLHRHWNAHFHRPGSRRNQHPQPLVSVAASASRQLEEWEHHRSLLQLGLCTGNRLKASDRDEKKNQIHTQNSMNWAERQPHLLQTYFFPLRFSNPKACIGCKQSS